MKINQKLKLILAMAIIFCIHDDLAEADTKVLRNIMINVDERQFRDETISLENDKDLVVKGSRVEHFDLPNGNNFVSITNYVADENGYRANYTLEESKSNEDLIRLGSQTFKSLAG